MLADSAIRVLAGRHSNRGPIVAGAVAIATGRVVGVSNVFSVQFDGEAVWRDIQAVAATAFSARPIVGYERGDALTHAIGSGFSPLRPLRVWYRDIA